jgi:hypothetical protein
MASGGKKAGKAKKGTGVAAARSSVVSQRQIPWVTIMAVVGVLALAAVVFGYYFVESQPKREQAAREEAAAEAFTPSAENPTPATDIPGIETEENLTRGHVDPTQRVAYDRTPPVGGPHDGAWATCNGVVYPEAVRTENLVHSLEHGAVWIAYDPERVSGDELELLSVRAEGQPYMVMSPYPGLEDPISLQSWGHQLKVESAEDERIDQFIVALRRNMNTFPEPNATCDTPQGFDQDNPPPFDPTPPGEDAVPMSFDGAGGGVPPADEGNGVPEELPEERPGDN